MYTIFNSFRLNSAMSVRYNKNRKNVETNVTSGGLVAKNDQWMSGFK